MDIYTVPTHALMKIHIFKHTTLVSNSYLFSKKIEHCSGVSVFVSVCVYGRLVCVEENSRQIQV